SDLPRGGRRACRLVPGRHPRTVGRRHHRLARRRLPARRERSALAHLAAKRRQPATLPARRRGRFRTTQPPEPRMTPTVNAAGARPAYYPYIDGLRAFAVLSVLI